MQEGIVGTTVVDLAFAAGVAMEMLVADLEHTLMQKSAAVPQISAQLSIMSVWVCPPSLTRPDLLVSSLVCQNTACKKIIVLQKEIALLSEIATSMGLHPGTDR